MFYVNYQQNNLAKSILSINDINTKELRKHDSFYYQHRYNYK